MNNLDQCILLCKSKLLDTEQNMMQSALSLSQVGTVVSC